MDNGYDFYLESAVNNGQRLAVKQGWSLARDEVEAVAELYDQVYQTNANVLIFFCSSKYDLDRLGRELAVRFDCPIVGCTTAGEIISAKGYLDSGIVGVTLVSDELAIHSRLITPLDRFDWQIAEIIAQEVKSELQLLDRLERDKVFGLLLVDGMSMLEEQVIASLFNQFDNIPIIGGSAGDDLRFEATRVYYDGRFHVNAAVFTLFETHLPFRSFRVQHFVPTEARLVITASDCATRTVFEINGMPAAEEYARTIGINLDDLTPQVFAAYPVMLRIGGEYFVRSIQKVNPDGSLTFYCAIDTGLVLTVTRGTELVENLRQNLQNLQEKIPDLKLVLGCDCILRRLELQQKGLVAEAEAVLREVNFLGFSTYGEQFDGIHVNQTLTGIAIGG